MSFSAVVGEACVGWIQVGAVGLAPNAHITLNFADSLNNLLDSIETTGGPPNYTLSIGDNVNGWKDSVKLSGSYIDPAISDSINNLADSAKVLLGIPIQAFDSNQSNLLDSIVVQFLAPLKGTFSDSFLLTDSFTFVLGNVRISITASDGLSLADAIKLRASLQVVITNDVIVLSDNISLQDNRFLKLGDSINNFLENVLFQYLTRPTFSDSINSLSDAPVIQLNVQLSVSKSDQLALADALATGTSGSYNGDLSRIRRYLNDLN